MSLIFSKKLLGMLSVALCMQLFVSQAGAKPHPQPPDHPYRYSIVDIPVSLGLGMVRTPEFTAPKTCYYWILVQVEKFMNFDELNCMLTTADIPYYGDYCYKPRLLQAEWTVFEEGKKTESGTNSNHSDAKYSTQNIFKFLGSFKGVKDRKYILEVNFTKDGTPLNINNPHLIIVKIGNE